MNTFETHPKPLKLLLTQIHNSELALPDFQRDFVWEPSAVEELIESIMRSYPAGSLLLLKHSGEGFQIREFEGAPTLKSSMATSYLVMDGQQRMTSLYQAFHGKGEHLFFLDIRELSDNEDVEAAVWHESRKRAERLRLTDIRLQAERLCCPLKVVMTDGFDAWIDEIMELRPEKGDQAKELRATLRKVNKEWISPILEYQFPVVTLSSDTPLDAVCKMFETLNRRGVKLTVFELLMARSFMNKVSLRKLWDEAQETYPQLEEFGVEPYNVLQTVSLLAGKNLKRSEILVMQPDQILEHWTKATKGLADAIIFLQRNAGVLSPNLLPYNTMLIPLAAAWAQTSHTKGPAEATRRDKLKTWFWASVFSQAYEKSPTSRSVSDYRDLVKWIAGEDKLPFGVRTLYFNPDMFSDISPKQRAHYRGTLALICSNAALDFHNAEPLTFDYLQSNKVDDHHIFPQAYLRKLDDEEAANCVLNRTLIDKVTNIRISDKAPSRYLSEIETEVGKGKLEKILSSHMLPSTELREDDFEEFRRKRAQMLFDKLQSQIGRDIPSTPTVYIEDFDSIEDEEANLTDPRVKYDAAVINAHPSALLTGLPKATEELFQILSVSLTTRLIGVWWKSNQSKVAFWSPEKVFLTARLAKSGIHITTFTDGKPIASVTPIVQKDQGGALWGRLKLKTKDDIEQTLAAILESHRRLQAAYKEGRPTAWWALTRKSGTA